jgi:hypothetical protein
MSVREVAGRVGTGTGKRRSGRTLGGATAPRTGWGTGLQTWLQTGRRIGTGTPGGA